MAHLGRFNTLTVVRETQSGFYLDGDQLGEILLPGRYIPHGLEVGGEIEVFVYRDSEDRLVATTERPRACVAIPSSNLSNSSWVIVVAPIWSPIFMPDTFFIHPR